MNLAIKCTIISLLTFIKVSAAHECGSSYLGSGINKDGTKWARNIASTPKAGVNLVEVLVKPSQDGVTSQVKYYECKAGVANELMSSKGYRTWARLRLPMTEYHADWALAADRINKTLYLPYKIKGDDLFGVAAISLPKPYQAVGAKGYTTIRMGNSFNVYFHGFVIEENQDSGKFVIDGYTAVAVRFPDSANIPEVAN